MGFALTNPNRFPPIRADESTTLHVRGDEHMRENVSVQVIDRVELGSHRIYFVDLARWLTELHGYAYRLARAWWG